MVDSDVLKNRVNGSETAGDEDGAGPDASAPPDLVEGLELSSGQLSIAVERLALALAQIAKDAPFDPTRAHRSRMPSSLDVGVGIYSLGNTTSKTEESSPSTEPRPAITPYTRHDPVSKSEEAASILRVDECQEPRIKEGIADPLDQIAEGGVMSTGGVSKSQASRIVHQVPGTTTGRPSITRSFLLLVSPSQFDMLRFYVLGLAMMTTFLVSVSGPEFSDVGIAVCISLSSFLAVSLLPRFIIGPTIVLIWLAPNAVSHVLTNVNVFRNEMWFELPPLLGIAFLTRFARDSLERSAKREALTTSDARGAESSPGVYHERFLRPALEMEVARSRRFKHRFAFVLTEIDPMRKQYDYRNESVWQESLAATGQMLSGTRRNIDRVFQYGDSKFAMILPESGPDEVNGLLRRLGRAARRAAPAMGEPGGPLPCHYGATFFPESATNVDDLLIRAEIALRVGGQVAMHVHLDGAEAVDMAAPESHRAYVEEKTEAA